MRGWGRLRGHLAMPRLLNDCPLDLSSDGLTRMAAIVSQAMAEFHSSLVSPVNSHVAFSLVNSETIS